MRMSDPKVSIIIPVFNQWRYTDECLHALQTSQDPDIPCEIIVVDNGSTDGTQAGLLGWQERWSIVRVERLPTSVGFSPACNHGAELAKASLLLFLNNDTIPQAGWLNPLIHAIETPGVGACGPKLLYPDRARVNHAGYVFGNGAFYPIYHDRPADFPPANRERDYQALLGACLLVPTQLFRELGGFSLSGLEDIDLCLKMGQRELACRYVPSSVVLHHGQVTHLLNPPGSFPVTSQSDFYARWGEYPIAWDDYRWLIIDELWPRPCADASIAASLELADRSMQSTISAFELRASGESQSALARTDQALELWSSNPVAYTLKCKLLLEVGAYDELRTRLTEYSRFSFSHRALIHLNEISQELLTKR